MELPSLNVGSMQQKLTFTNALMIMATAAGAASVFPKMPALISDLFDDDTSPNAEAFQYMALYILILQGGGDFKHDLAIMGTVGYFLAVKGLNLAFPTGLRSIKSSVVASNELDPTELTGTDVPHTPGY